MHAPAFAPASWRQEKWEIHVENPAPGLLLARASGMMDLESVGHLMDAFDQVAAAHPGKVDAFHDWEEMDGYAPDARQRYITWSKSHQERLSGVNILVRSRLVHMAVAVSNVVVGGAMRAYSVRAHWEEALNKAIASRTPA